MEREAEQWAIGMSSAMEREEEQQSSVMKLEEEQNNNGLLVSRQIRLADQQAECLWSVCWWNQWLQYFLILWSRQRRFNVLAVVDIEAEFLGHGRVEGPISDVNRPNFIRLDVGVYVCWNLMVIQGRNQGKTKKKM